MGLLPSRKLARSIINMMPIALIICDHFLLGQLAVDAFAPLAIVIRPRNVLSRAQYSQASTLRLPMIIVQSAGPSFQVRYREKLEAREADVEAEYGTCEHGGFVAYDRTVGLVAQSASNVLRAGGADILDVRGSANSKCGCGHCNNCVNRKTNSSVLMEDLLWMLFGLIIL